MQITMLIPMRPPGVSAISTPLKALVVCNVKTVQDVPLRTVRLRELRLWSAMCTSFFFFFLQKITTDFWRPRKCRHLPHHLAFFSYMAARARSRSTFREGKPRNEHADSCRGPPSVGDLSFLVEEVSRREKKLKEEADKSLPSEKEPFLHPKEP